MIRAFKNLQKCDFSITMTQTELEKMSQKNQRIVKIVKFTKNFKNYQNYQMNFKNLYFF